MVFVRSASSVHFFPRYIFFCFLGYHFYFLSSTATPYPFISLALIPLSLFITMGMIFTLLVCEIPAISSGRVSLECPREVFLRVSWPEWSAALPQDFTLFLPLNSRYRSLYDTDVQPTANPQRVPQFTDDESYDSSSSSTT